MSRRSHFRPAAERRAAAPAAASRTTRSSRRGTDLSPSFHSRRRLRFEPLETRELLAVVTVTTVADTVDFNDGVTSLREAIFATNLVEGADEIRFAPSLTAGGAAAILLTQGELTITDDLTITGPGAELLTIDASGNDPTPREKNGDGTRVFNVDDGILGSIQNVSLSRLTLTGGDVLGSGGAIYSRDTLALSDSIIHANAASVDGGGVFSEFGSLTVINSRVSANQLTNRMRDGRGGGIASIGVTTVQGSQIVDNVANIGGGLFLQSREAYLTNCLVADNVAIGSGGGAFVEGQSTWVRCTVNGNVAAGETFIVERGAGGGIYSTGMRSFSGRLSLNDCTIAGNRSRFGGGVYSDDSSVIANSEFRQNSAIQDGGAVYSAGDVSVSYCDIQQNVANRGGGLFAASGESFSVAQVSVANSILSGNTAAVGGGAVVYGESVWQFCAITGNTAFGQSTQPVSSPSGGGGLRLDGKHRIEQSTISSNFSGGAGGGLFVAPALLDTDRSVTPYVTIIQSAIERNIARNGGGILFNGSYIQISESTVQRNLALFAGGGIYYSGINLIVENVTVSANVADTGGGIVIYNDSSRESQIRSSTIANNTGGIYISSQTGVSLYHSIIANNNVGSQYDVGAGSAIITAQFSLIGSKGDTSLVPTADGIPDEFGNLIGGNTSDTYVDPRLAPLADNGGVTLPDGSQLLTHALLPGSPAINEGDPNAVAGEGVVPVHDQRGAPFTRIYGGRIDIGAFEVQPEGVLFGDYNLDGVVDTGDYTVWRNGMGMSVPAGRGADGNGDGLVDLQDYTLWKANYGCTLADVGSGSALVTAGEAQLTAPVSAGALVVETLESTLPADSLADNAQTASLAGMAVAGMPIIVTTIDDTVDFNDGVTSLREAIFATNLVEGADEIRFAPALTAAGAATILLTQGELKITDDLTIMGPGADLLTIDASGNDPTPGVKNGDGSRVFTVNDEASQFVAAELLQVSISNVTLTGGDTGASGGAIDNRENLSLVYLIVTGNSSSSLNAASHGGGVFSSGILNVTDSQIVSNTALRGNGSGGGIYSTGTTNLTRTTVAQNRSDGQGGGVVHAISSSFSRALAVVDSTISENAAGASGGGLIAYLLLMSDSTVSNNSSVGSGGGMQVGTGQVSNSTINRNRTTGENAHGGGIVFLGGNRAAPIVVVDSQVSENLVLGIGSSGGGIYFSSLIGGLSGVEGTSVSGNFAAGEGGGIYSASNRFQIVASRLSGNIASGDGGGIFASSNASGLFGITAQIIGTTIDHNTGGTGGGATLKNVRIADCTLFNNQSGSGGGIWIAGGEVVQCTISQNSAGVGAGIYANSADIFFNTIAYNSSSILGGGIFVADESTSIDHSIIAGNLAQVGPDIARLTDESISATFSLIGNNSDSGLTATGPITPDAHGNFIGGATESTTIDPNLQPLADNGGLTMTHAFMHGSLARNAGDLNAVAGENGVPVHDQRGAPFTRIYGGRIDIGAFEEQRFGKLLGDYNQNGVVDTGDYTVWRNMMGTSVPAGTGADGNGDGLVDLQDYALWKANYGCTLEDALFAVAADVSAASAAVTETEVRSPALSTSISPLAPVFDARGIEHAEQIAAPNIGRRVDADRVALRKPAATSAPKTRPGDPFERQALTTISRREAFTDVDDRNADGRSSTTALDEAYAGFSRRGIALTRFMGIGQLPNRPVDGNT
jgi:predicted outer membrane repeat protein